MRNDTCDIIELKGGKKNGKKPKEYELDKKPVEQ